MFLVQGCYQLTSLARAHTLRLFLYVVLPMRNWLKKLSVALALLVIGFIALSFSWVRYYKWKHDRTFGSTPVTNVEQLDSIFNHLDMVDFTEIPESYRQSTWMEKNAYKDKLKSRRFYMLNRADAMHRVVGHYRIWDFLPADQHRQAMLVRNRSMYVCLDTKIFVKFIQLLDRMKALEYRTDEVQLFSCYRHPKRNYFIGGASQSRHIYGEAIDLRIGDIDGDGTVSAKDKQIVLDLLDKEVIKDEGGIGLYPGTQAVHMDVRGKKARWNTYTPAIKKKKI